MKRKKKSRKLLSYLFIPLLLLTSGYLFLRSSFFDLKKIDIRCAEQNKGEYAKAVISLKGVNLFAINDKEIEDKLLAYPKVKTVSIKRKYPDTLVIFVNERRPFIALPQNNQKVAVLADDFTVIDLIDPGSLDLPVVVGFEGNTLKPGEKVSAEKLEPIKRYLQAMNLEQKELLSTFKYDSEEGVVGYTKNGVKLIFGDDRDVQQKLIIALGLFQELGNKGKKIEYINVSFKGAPVVKYEETDRTSQQK
ncbi:cell division protein FtsQ [Carboxydothermus islandicus]|uniref:Cell division protein FtsQ n=1 Tax=Carboxydothermus islandicus TaxID=661089 RepID=A0A1L8D3H0_9THEO|nr:FtsQ-type POTRA domain-containing protein [Carboxydothermus islandicus]GAV25746.1 cell division protein FtsQ [Carboxydothermus islandicus]